MNISNQDKAFIITFSSAAILVLIFFFTTVKPFEPKTVEEFIDIPIVEELPEELTKAEEKEEMIAQNEPISHQIKNDALQKEAERFFSQEDEIRDEITDEQKTEPQSNEEVSDEEALNEYKKKLQRLRDKVDQQETAAKKAAKDPSSSEPAKTKRRTSISYILKKRNALQIPNPVYTCAATGKVVVNIQVSDMGSVVKTSYNKTASTTSNGCLIDQALKYASKARFNTGSQKGQLGSITFEFQG